MQCVLKYTKASHTGIQQYLHSNIKREGFLDPLKQGWMRASNEGSEPEGANT